MIVHSAMAAGRRQVTRGILAVYTGEGKGKTTAALGTVFRALGHGHKVVMIQFIKGSWPCGEHAFADKFTELVPFMRDDFTTTKTTYRNDHF